MHFCNCKISIENTLKQEKVVMCVHALKVHLMLSVAQERIERVGIEGASMDSLLQSLVL